MDFRVPTVWPPNVDCMEMYSSESSRFVFIEQDNTYDFLQSLPQHYGMSVCFKEESSTNWAFAIGITQPEKILLIIFHEPADSPYLYVKMESLDKHNIRLAVSLNPRVDECLQSKLSPRNVVIFSHGHSPDVGPNYWYIRSLEKFIRNLGSWHIIVPDYRPTYGKESIHLGHCERTKLLLEELVCLRGQQARVVLIGKSQGGAVAASVCNERVVNACKIVGLVLIGAENPLSYKRDFPKPPVQHMTVIHAAGDRVIHPESLRQLSEAWEMTNCHIMPSRIMAGTKDRLGNDMNHAFMDKDLFVGSMELVRASLEACESLTVS